MTGLLDLLGVLVKVLDVLLISHGKEKGLADRLVVHLARWIWSALHKGVRWAGPGPLCPGNEVWGTGLEADEDGIAVNGVECIDNVRAKLHPVQGSPNRFGVLSLRARKAH